MKDWVKILGRGIGKSEGILAKEGGCSGEKMGMARTGKGKGEERVRMREKFGGGKCEVEVEGKKTRSVNREWESMR